MSILYRAPWSLRTPLAEAVLPPSSFSGLLAAALLTSRAVVVVRALFIASAVMEGFYIFPV